jgi:hypothetical protein
MEALDGGYLVNLGGCLGLQGNPAEEAIGLPLLLAGSVQGEAVRISDDGHSLHLRGEDFVLGERVVVGGGWIETGSEASQSALDYWGPIPDDCPADYGFFVADSVKKRE